MTAREEILQKLYAGRKNHIEHNDEINDSTEIYPTRPNDLLSLFSDELTKIQGELIIVESDSELSDRISEIASIDSISKILCSDHDLLQSLELKNLTIESEVFSDENRIGITQCEFLIARTASVLVSSLKNGRRMNVFPENHIVIADESQIVYDLEDALGKLNSSQQSQISIISGPSRTADIEKTLVMGAHGPKRIIIFIKKY